MTMRNRSGGTPARTVAPSRQAAQAAATPSRRAAAPEPEVEEDEWQTGSGMADDFIGYIQDPFFGVDDNYNAEAVLFQAELVGEDGEPVTTLKYSVGQDWEEGEDGMTISHPTKTKINANSRYGRFIDRCIGPVSDVAPKNKQVVSPDGLDKGLGLGSILRGRGSPREAKVWDGLGFHWRLHQMETMGKDDDGNTIMKDVLLPVAYVGVWGEEENAAPKGRAVGRTAPAPAPTPARNGAARQVAAPATAPVSRRAAPAPAPAPEPEEDSSLIELIPTRLRNRLIQSAQSSDARTFIRTATRDREVSVLPEEVVEYVLSAGESGFWAEVNAEEEEPEIEE